MVKVRLEIRRALAFSFGISPSAVTVAVAGAAWAIPSRHRIVLKKKKKKKKAAPGAIVECRSTSMAWNDRL